MRRRKVLILDCTPRSEPREGRILREFFRICKLYRGARAEALYFPVRSKGEFLRKLNSSKKYDIIHISAHGDSHGVGNGATWSATASEISDRRIRARLVFLNACLANRRAMARAFNSTVFIAPTTVVEWKDAVLFAITFYKRHVIDGVSTKSAVSFARTHTKTTKDYPHYWTA